MGRKLLCILLCLLFCCAGFLGCLRGLLGLLEEHLEGTFAVEIAHRCREREK